MPIDNTAHTKPSWIFGVPVWDVDPEQFFHYIIACVQSQTACIAGYVNPHACVLALRKPSFRRLIQSHDMNFCDGIGVRWALRRWGVMQKHRWTLPDHIDTLLCLCREEGLRVFFMGENEQDLSLFIRAVRSSHPGVRIVGGQQGYVNPVEDGDAVANRLSRAKADIVLLAMGMPKQEQWAAFLRQRVDRGAFLVVGALFQYYSGVEKRCPALLSRHGFEWAYRLVRNPIKYFRRYVIENVFFIFRVLVTREGGYQNEQSQR